MAVLSLIFLLTVNESVHLDGASFRLTLSLSRGKIMMDKTEWSSAKTRAAFVFLLKKKGTNKCLALSLCAGSRTVCWLEASELDWRLIKSPSSQTVLHFLLFDGLSVEPLLEEANQSSTDASNKENGFLLKKEKKKWEQERFSSKILEALVIFSFCSLFSKEKENAINFQTSCGPDQYALFQSASTRPTEFERRCVF